MATRVAEELAVAGTLTAIAPAPPTNTSSPPSATPPAQPIATPTVPPTEAPARPTEPVKAPTVAPTATRLQVTVVPPPKPPPKPTATPITVAVLAVDGSDGNQNLRNNRGVKQGRNVLLPGFSQSQVTQPMTFRDRIVFQVEVFDAQVGQRDGAGIKNVRFRITDENGKLVHERTESSAGYCVFGGGEPDCTVWEFSKQGNRWPDGAPKGYGAYDVEILITPNKGDPVRWFWNFRIE